MSKINKEIFLITMFKSITNEEGKINKNCDVQILNKQVVKRKSIVDKLKKGHVGMPKKVVGCKFFFIHH
jgi:hypothetical protein